MSFSKILGFLPKRSSSVSTFPEESFMITSIKSIPCSFFPFFFEQSISLISEMRLAGYFQTLYNNPPYAPPYAPPRIRTCISDNNRQTPYAPPLPLRSASDNQLNALPRKRSSCERAHRIFYKILRLFVRKIRSAQRTQHGHVRTSDPPLNIGL